ncbi:AMP-binding protein [Nocardia sp. NPDC004168]|uniref:AMP-binding protein n=1 Tax=Nocardia sp. NPDC004168 TaxID=3154452 RepID=UPI0033B1BD2C
MLEALLAGEDEVAFHTLDRRFSQLARVLIDRGAGPGDVVAVTLPRSVYAVVAAWAVQKAGAACLFAGDLTAEELTVVGAGFGISSCRCSTAAFAGWHSTTPTCSRTSPMRLRTRFRTPTGSALLGEEHPAFVVTTADGVVAITQSEALDEAERVREEHEIDYASTTYTIALSGRPPLLEFLTSAAAGAPSVVPTGDLETDLTEGEVTHWFTAPDESTDAAGEKIIFGTRSRDETASAGAAPETFGTSTSYR